MLRSVNGSELSQCGAAHPSSTAVDDRSAADEIGRDATGRPLWPLLFTPGPLTTSATTKAAMQIDLGSRDARFLSVVRNVRSELLRVGGVSQEAGFECVLMQGSGTFAIESVIGSAIPRHGAKLLVAENGAYGQRMATMVRER